MSNCHVPNWNLRHQQRQVLDQPNERNKSCHPIISNNHHHFHDPDNFSQLAPMSNFEVAELTWENGQLALNELGGIFPPPTSTTAKPTWGGPGPGPMRGFDTLESIVHQATYCNTQGPNLTSAENMGSVVGSCGGKLAHNSGPVHTPTTLPPPPGLVKKRMRSEPDHSRRINNVPMNDHESACASANAAVSKENTDTTMMTWTSLDSPRSCTRTKTTHDEDSTCLRGLENHEEERDTKGETGLSHIPRRGRAAAVHNQSERRRRDRINQKMKALQKLVPNASKTDKASMLDEVIEYLKQLQAQVQMMSNARLMPQFMMPFGMQQLQQMSLLARMGMGIGMLDPTSNCHTPTPSHPISQLIHPNHVGTANSSYVPSAFVAPQMFNTAQQPNLDIGAGASSTLQDPYSALLAQSMNLDLFNRVATLQRQQQAQAQQISNQMHPNNQMQGN